MSKNKSRGKCAKILHRFLTEMARGRPAGAASQDAKKDRSRRILSAAAAVLFHFSVLFSAVPWATPPVAAMAAAVTSIAPACCKASAQADAVAPVVIMSSTSSTRLPVRSVPGRQAKAAFCGQALLAGQLLLRLSRSLCTAASPPGSPALRPTGAPAKAASRQAGQRLAGRHRHNAAVQRQRRTARDTAGQLPGVWEGSAPKISTAIRSASSCAYHRQPPRLQRKIAWRTASA